MNRMIRLPTPHLLAAIALLALLPACSRETPEPAPLEESQLDAELPPGHPPVGAGQDRQVLAPLADDLGTGAAALVWDTPATWSAETPANNLRRAQYRVPGDGGDGECVVFYFGPGKGGEALPNAVRWASQFTQPDGSSSESATEIGNRLVGDMPVLTVEVTGNYFTGSPNMGGTGETLEGYRLLGAVAEGPDANWFFKLTGPEQTVEQNRSAFEEMIDSLRRGSAEADG